ncbi:hypothetical protein C464_06200 [Halorubrum coriense DSM 10284]|uniref:Uncharacterized protein n=1 Tax=Halorubrum coriense DSM 10284 TaxID=1227466 RepID=M0EMM6_9EURY|nr:hypothetical protein [Halorubrum coriense]ELZ48980.1 hypothetical protein C464_06200 [Halorubrum coriense DSM 10284]QRG24125.1 hypothetical protein HrrHm1_070 [Halorubrum virus Humcor1]
MSAPSNYDATETLSGAWTDVSLVESPGATEETETFLTRTAGEISITPNTNQWESEPNASRHRESGTEHVDYTVEVPLDHDAETDLEELGVVDDTSKKRIFNDVHDAVRLYVFKDREDADGEEVIQREMARVRVEETEESFASGDPANATITLRVMGEIKHEFSTQ